MTGMTSERNRWLIVVYVILSVWAVYYLVTYWSGP